MSGSRAADAVDPDAARRDAQHILSDRRFHSGSTPRPLRGQLRWLGDRVQDVLDPIGRVLSSLPGWVWWLFGAAVVGLLTWAFTRTRVRLRARAERTRFETGDLETAESADALERAADEAERDGHLERAVRLRFRAGLLRLGDRGAIRYRPSVTTSEVRHTLDSARFDDLAGTFEAVTYGGREAASPDVDAARNEWPQVLDEAGRR